MGDYTTIPDPGFLSICLFNNISIVVTFPLIKTEGRPKGISYGLPFLPLAIHQLPLQWCFVCFINVHGKKRLLCGLPDDCRLPAFAGFLSVAIPGKILSVPRLGTGCGFGPPKPSQPYRPLLYSLLVEALHQTPTIWWFGCYCHYHWCCCF